MTQLPRPLNLKAHALGVNRSFKHPARLLSPVPSVKCCTCSAQIVNYFFSLQRGAAIGFMHQWAAAPVLAQQGGQRRSSTPAGRRLRTARLIESVCGPLDHTRSDAGGVQHGLPARTGGHRRPPGAQRRGACSGSRAAQARCRASQGGKEGGPAAEHPGAQ